MSDELAGLVDQVTAVLQEETALLDALNLPAATGLLSRKRDAVAALQGALSSAGDGAGSGGDEEGSDKLRDSARRMADAAEVNRVAIERGLELQMRLIQAIAQAVPRARAVEAPVYQPDGSQVPARPPDAYAFLSRM